MYWMAAWVTSIVKGELVTSLSWVVFPAMQSIESVLCGNSDVDIYWACVVNA